MDSDTDLVLSDPDGDVAEEQINDDASKMDETNGDKIVGDNTTGNETIGDGNNEDGMNLGDMYERVEGSDPLEIILKIHFDFLEDANKLLQVKETLVQLGVKNVSDLTFVEHGTGLKEAFEKILNPVQIGKLKVNLQKHSCDTIAKKKEKPSCAINFAEVFSPALLRELTTAKSRVSDKSRKRALWDVADSLFADSKKESRRKSESVAVALLSSFGNAFKNEKSKNKSNSRDILTLGIFNHWKYLNRKHSLKATEGRQTKQLNPTPSEGFSKRENFGIDMELDMPATYPEGESHDTQVQKQQRLKDMYNSGEFNSKDMNKLMADTYVLQRLLINGKVNMEKILLEWPFFGKYKILEKHFCKLMKIKMKDVLDNLGTFSERFLKYLTAEGDKIRKGASASIPIKIRNIIKTYDNFKEGAETNLADYQFAAVILALIVKLKENEKDLFIYFEETASFDEIQASTKLPEDGKPRVAVLGTDLFEAEKCFVVVEKRIISPTSTSILKGIFSAFMLYWVLKILYPRRLAGTFQFLEREIFLMEFDTNSRTSRVDRGKEKGRWRTCPPAINKQYQTVMDEFASYCEKWE